jgi:predicted phage terminase large subunit-like protein
VVIAYDPERGIFYVLEVDVDRRRPSETIERIIDYAKKYEVIKVGVEVNQFQVLMADDLRRRADEENIRMPMARVTNTSNKRMRIESLQPLFESERIQISRKHYALIEELQYFPKGKHDDALDALEIAIRTATGCTARFGIRSI